MKIDLTKLNSEIITTIDINETVSFPKEILCNSEIKELNDVKVEGTITKNSTNDNILNIQVNGSMILEDSINLEMIPYPFTIQILEEIVKSKEKDENILDIMELLWQNIMLEIPLKFTKVKDFDEFQGDGWKLISEDDLKDENNPFNDLKSMMGEE